MDIVGITVCKNCRQLVEMRRKCVSKPRKGREPGKGGLTVIEGKCLVCGSEDVVDTGPLTVHGQEMVVSVGSAQQCTLCGNLEITVPQVLLVQLYPPGVRYLTSARRAQAQRRRRAHRQMGI